MSEWSYIINYGPECEANYANVFDGQERLVGNLRIHHAIAVVSAMNAAPDLDEAARELIAPPPFTKEAWQFFERELEQPEGEIDQEYQMLFEWAIRTRDAIARAAGADQ